MVDFMKSIKLPFTDWKQLAIGMGIMVGLYIGMIIVGVMLLIIGMIFRIVGVWVLLACIFAAVCYISSFILAGYVVRIASNAMRRRNSTLPKWDNWKGLFEDGFNVSLVYLAYYFVPVALMIAGAAQIFMHAAPFMHIGMADAEMASIFARSITTTSAALLVSGVFLLVFLSYFGYMAMLSYSVRRKLSDAFNLKAVVGKSMSGKYLLGFLFLVAYTFALSIFGAAAAAVLSIVGAGFGSMIINYFVSMVTLITISDAMGQVYGGK